MNSAKIKNAFMNLGLSVFCLILLFLAAELFFRWRFDIREGGFRKTGPYKGHLIDDERLVWRPTPYFKVKFTAENEDGSTYGVSYSSSKDGFRKWGNPDSSRKKIFVIGDSFTQAVQVSDGKAYYDFLERALEVEIFVFGADGYGSLQEWMILEEYLSTLKPDLIVWQFCSNDLSNNSMKYSYQTFMLQYPRRPFLDHGRIVYREPSAFFQFLSHTIHTTPSRFLFFLASRSLSLYMGEPVAGKKRIVLRQATGASDLPSTEEIFRQIADTVGPTPFYFFSNSEISELKPFFEGIFRRESFHVVDEVRPRLERAKKSGEIVLTSDGIHWNERGHEIVAEVLIKPLREALA